MVKWCTKFRVFNVLLLLCLVNVLVFRQYFLGGLQARRSGTLWHYGTNSTIGDAAGFITQSLGTESRPSVLVQVQNTRSVNETAKNAEENGSKISQGYSDVTKENRTVSHHDATKGSHDVTVRSGNVTKGVAEDRNVTDKKADVRRRISDVIKETQLANKARDNRNTTKNGSDTAVEKGTSSVSGNNIVPVHPEAKARALVAVEKLVLPRAGLVAPWKKDNSTTLCPLVPPALVGQLATYSEAPNFTEIVRLNQGLEPGGHYHPPDCKARHRVAIIVPYRDREEHLRVLLHNLHPILIRQQLDYFILVVEMAMPTQFNRGMLLNIGAVEALGLWDVDCFILHDVDLVPENDRNLYTCPEMPRHMSAAVDKFRYKLPYSGIFGGVTALRKEHFFKINGYSNVYFGWGGEDDDLSGRVTGSGLKVTRYSMDVARYRMIKHGRDKKNEPNPKRFQMLNQWKKRQTKDGLNSLQYEVKKVEFREGYTWILVSVDKKAILEPLNIKS